DNVVIVDALSSAPKISDSCGPNYFRVMASDSLAGKYNVDWALESGLKHPVIVYVEDDWGASYKSAVQRYLSEKGVTLADSLGVTAGTRDYRTLVERIKSDQPDAIFLLVYAKEGASFMQQLRQGGVNATVYGSDNISSSEFTAAGPDIVEGVR